MLQLRMTTTRFNQRRALYVPVAASVAFGLGLALHVNSGIQGLLLIPVMGSAIYFLPLGLIGRAIIDDGVLTIREAFNRYNATQRGVDLGHLVNCYGVYVRWGRESRHSFPKLELVLEDDRGGRQRMPYGWWQSELYDAIREGVSQSARARPNSAVTMDKKTAKRLGLRGEPSGPAPRSRLMSIRVRLGRRDSDYRAP